MAATHPERTPLVTRGRTPSGTRRWALRAASPARHPDAQGARVERQAAREDWLQSRRPPGRGMMCAWSCSGSRKLPSRAREGPTPPPCPRNSVCARVEACACRSTAARGWHCDEGCARPRRARHGLARRAYRRQLSRHGNAYPGSSSEPGRRRRDATAAHSTSSARCPALSPAARSDGRRLARCSAPWRQTEERPRGVCDVRCGV